MAKHLLWLLPLSGLAVWGAFQVSSWPVGWQTLLFYSPAVMAGMGLFISLWLNRLLPALMMITIALVALGVTLLPIYLTNSYSTHIEALIAFLFPLNLLLWLWAPEKGVRHRGWVLTWMSLFVAQAVLLIWGMDSLPKEWLSAMVQPVTTEENFFIQVPMLSSLLLLLTANVLMIRLAMIQKHKVLDWAAIFVLFIMAFGLNQSDWHGVMGWLASIAILLVILSMIFDAHLIAYTDELTGMAGRRALFESFMGIGRQYSIVMIDIDHFKQFNDRYGHDIGDLVLKTVSQVLNSVGSGGKAYRFGGEEFTVVFAGKKPDKVRPVMDALRQAVADTDLSFEHKGKLTQTKVTVSMGVAEKTAELKTPEEVIKAADQALYQAKETGRNRVVVMGDPVEKTIRKGQKSARIRKRKKS